MRSEDAESEKISDVSTKPSEGEKKTQKDSSCPDCQMECAKKFLNELVTVHRY